VVVGFAGFFGVVVVVPVVVVVSVGFSERGFVPTRRIVGSPR
jgi:hypothetical protein